MTEDPVPRRAQLLQLQSAPIPTSTGSEQPAEIPDELQFTAQDVVIAVMGVTGSGKTTFVNHFSENELVIGHGLEPCTQDVQVVPCILDKRRLFLVDTPGFDDTYRSDTDILREIVTWLNAAHRKHIKLTGIIYLHRIQDVRIGGAGVRNIRMFKKLCGDDSLGSVVLATTMWEGTAIGLATAREKELRTHEVFWKNMVENGSKMFRQDDGSKSAAKIVQYLIKKKQPVTLDVQREMVDEHKALGETGAGNAIGTEFQSQKDMYEKKLTELRKELEEAIRKKDKDAEEEAEIYKAEIEGKLSHAQQQMQKLYADNEQLYEETRKKYEEQLRTLSEQVMAKEMELKQKSLEHKYDVELQKLQTQMKMKERFYQMMYSPKCIVM